MAAMQEVDDLGETLRDGMLVTRRQNAAEQQRVKAVVRARIHNEAGF